MVTFRNDFKAYNFKDTETIYERRNFQEFPGTN